MCADMGSTVALCRFAGKTERMFPRFSAAKRSQNAGFANAESGDLQGKQNVCSVSRYFGL
jgi:hypothetical protein